jgi:hypothetical protein
MLDENGRCRSAPIAARSVAHNAARHRTRDDPHYRFARAPALTAINFSHGRRAVYFHTCAQRALPPKC